MAIYRGPGGAGDATNDATSQSILAAASAVAAANSEAAAAASATSAASSASAASTSATNASNSATAAAASATNAANSATSAASSASTATTKASEAATSATNAASSATSAATSATNASNSATSAASSASTATTKAAEASTSATAAAASATAAATSESNADISEANAASSATAAATSATNASNSASAAATSATNAANSASSATTSATNAANSASAAAASASNAATSATSASNSATSASTSATNAANSASSASTSATNAASSATAAAASYDSFDDRYLGSKTSNPTLDSDGNALLTGALYWNSTVGEMRVYNGSAWVAAYVPAATYVAKAGDVMTGSLEVPTQASLKATALTRASIRPSLLLDFANTKQLDPRIAFSRSTTGSYFDSNGVLQTAAANVARFDHDPVTGESKGLLIEEQRTNLLTYSQEFDNTAWVKAGTPAPIVTPNTGVAPDGTLSADTIEGATNIITTASAINLQRTGIAVSANTSYTYTLYARPLGGTDISLRARTSSGTNSATASYLLNGTDVGNGWRRITLTFSTGASDTSANLYVGGQNGSFLIWGAQLEAGSFPTSYIPTVASQVTRSADSASITGSNFSSWYRADEGTVYGEFDVIGLGSTTLYNGALSFDDGSINNAMELSVWDAASDSLRWAGYSSGTSQWSITPKTYTSGFTKGAGAYKVNNFNSCFDSTLGTDDTLGSVPVVNRFNIGCNRGGGTANALNGHVKRIAYYPKRLSNTELQGLTS